MNETTGSGPHSMVVAEAVTPGVGTPWIHPHWAQRFPWLAQGTTARGPEGAPFDLALFREGAPPAPRERWPELAGDQGFGTIVHARQVHGSRVEVWGAAGAHLGPSSGGEVGDPLPDAPTLILAPDADGHATAVPGILMAVTVADCVPVFLVDPDRRAVALLHAGWRGVVAGVLEEGIAALGRAFGSAPPDLFLHLGPSICGDCYEVGPEVHGALGLPVPGKPTPVDLRAVLGDRARQAGVRPEHLTRSGHCTRCGGSPFFSHRGGDPERQVAFLGIRDGA